MWVLNSVDTLCESHTLYYSEKGIRWYSVSEDNTNVPVVKKHIQNVQEEEETVANAVMKHDKYDTPEIGRKGNNDGIFFFFKFFFG